MSEGKKIELRELAELLKGSWKVGDEQLPYIALEHIVENGLRFEGVGDPSIDCKFGAYYDTYGMGELTLKYVSTTGNFVQATANDKANQSTTIYFERKWIAFD